MAIFEPNLAKKFSLVSFKCEISSYIDWKVPLRYFYLLLLVFECILHEKAYWIMPVSLVFSQHILSLRRHPLWLFADFQWKNNLFYQNIICFCWVVILFLFFFMCFFFCQKGYPAKIAVLLALHENSLNGI